MNGAFDLGKRAYMRGGEKENKRLSGAEKKGFCEKKVSHTA